MVINEHLKKPDKCECGAEIPWHLVGVGNARFSHICSCENHYAWVDRETLAYIGKRANPFARHDKERDRGGEEE